MTKFPDTSSAARAARPASLPSASRTRRGRGATLRRAALIGGVVLLTLAVVAVGAISWVGADRTIHQPPKSWPWSVADYPDLRPLPVTIPSRTGITLAGTFFPGSSRATIILSHGYGNAQAEVIPWAAFLVRAGFSVLTYDMRARGGSGGDTIPFGVLEQDDLLSVLDYAAARPDVDPERIGALGVSLGGVVTILAAARTPMRRGRSARGSRRISA